MGLIKNIIHTTLWCSIIGLIHAGGCTGKELRSESAPPRLQSKVAPLTTVVQQPLPIKPAVSAPLAPATHGNAAPIATAVVRQQPAPVAAMPASVPAGVVNVAPKPVVTMSDTGAGVSMPVTPPADVTPQQPMPVGGDVSFIHDPRVKWGAALFIIWWYWNSIKKQLEPKKEDEENALTMRSSPKKVVQLRVAPKKQE